MLPFKDYNSISLILQKIKELIGTRQRQHKIGRRLRESAKKKKVKRPSGFLKLLNYFHNKFEVKKRKNRKVMYVFHSIFQKMRPRNLNFFMFRLKGKVNSKTRKQILKIKHNFSGIKLYNKDFKRKYDFLDNTCKLKSVNNQFYYQFLPIRAKIGAFGFHFFGERVYKCV